MPILTAGGRLRGELLLWVSGTCGSLAELVGSWPRRDGLHGEKKLPPCLSVGWTYPHCLGWA